MIFFQIKMLLKLSSRIPGKWVRADRVLGWELST